MTLNISTTSILYYTLYFLPGSTSLTDKQIPRSAITDSVQMYFKQSEKTSTDKELGTARYYHIVVEGKRLEDAAWYYDGKEAGEMKDWIAFRKSCGR